jgi:hypothetical protein
LYGTVDGCHCDCGAYDPDCAVAGQAVLNCEHLQTCNMQGDCEGGVPAGWNCTDTYYDDVDDFCDCGCGIADPDCTGSTLVACDYCEIAGGSCATDEDDCAGVHPGNNAICGSVPDWDCPPFFYGDGECDCGCGAVDMDCPNATAAVCEFCTPDEGSCSVAGCSQIDPTNNAVCTN